jgi:hypothetical protein
MFNSSDAWFLTTLILIKDWASLREVIAGGDLINRAIFTTEEINTALTVLIAFGYVEINGDKYMHATEKAYGFCDKTFLKAGIFSKVQIIFEKLKRTPYFEPIQLVQYFTEDEFHQAYSQYIGKLKK